MGLGLPSGRQAIHFQHLRETALSKILTGPPASLTPLSFPSQNHRYTEERDIPSRPATSLGLSSFSDAMCSLLRVFALIPFQEPWQLPEHLYPFVTEAFIVP